MKLAFSSNAYLRFTLEETVRRIAGLGYTGIELLADVPHGEAITATEGRAPTFYVTESRDLPNDLFDLGSYELAVATD